MKIMHNKELKILETGEKVICKYTSKTPMIISLSNKEDLNLKNNCLYNTIVASANCLNVDLPVSNALSLATENLHMRENNLENTEAMNESSEDEDVLEINWFPKNDFSPSP